MSVNILEKLYEHNNWANQQVLQACLALSDAQLDAEPQTVTKGSIRETLVHIASAQMNYLRNLTLPLDDRRDPVQVDYAGLSESLASSGTGLLELARNPSPLERNPLYETRDGSLVETWVVMLQVLSHSAEHREQIKSMITALGLTPPDVGGFGFARFKQAVHSASK